ncbi:MMPL family transporter [Mycobacterium ulcerans]
MSTTQSVPGQTGTTAAERPFVARMIRTLAVPIILFWLAVVVLLSVFVPSLEVVGQERSVSLSPTDAPSVVALNRIGHVFNEGETDSVAMIILEGDKPLGDDAHKFYDGLIRKLRADKKHVLSIQDFWGNPLTAAAPRATTAWRTLSR